MEQMTNCTQCEHTKNCMYLFGGLGCKKREEILKQVKRDKSKSENN